MSGVKTPALDPNSTEGKDLQQTVQRQLGDDVIGQYVARLENDLGTNVNAAVLAQAMGQNNAPDTN